MKSKRIFLLTPYDAPWSNGRFIERALIKLGHDVKVFDYVKQPSLFLGKLPFLSMPGIYPKIIKLGIHGSDEQLKKSVGDYNPDLVLSIKGESVLPQTIDWISNKLGIPTANWFPDDPILHDEISRFIAPSYDYFFTSSERFIGKYKEMGVYHAYWVPFGGCDPDTHKVVVLSKKEKEYFGSDICFVGTAYPERLYAFESLKDFDFKIWGKRWKRSNLFIKLLLQTARKKTHYNIPSMKVLRVILNSGIWKNRTRTSLYGIDMVKAFNASKIILNVHHAQTMLLRFGGTRANPRDYEATACRSFLLSDRPEGIEKMFRVGREIVCYESIGELKELCRYYLDHEEERMKIAERGQKRAYREHTYVKRLRGLLSKIKF